MSKQDILSFSPEEIVKLLDVINQQLIVLTEEQKKLDSSIDRLVRNKNVLEALYELKQIPKKSGSGAKEISY